MVKELGELRLEDTDVLLSFNITALFINVPVDKSKGVVLHKPEEDTSLTQRTKL